MEDSTTNPATPNQALQRTALDVTASSSTPSFRFRRWFVWLSSFAIAFILYALSFGPVLYLCGARVGGGRPSLPPFVRFIYGPLQFADNWLLMAYERYIYSWLIEPPAK